MATLYVKVDVPNSLRPVAESFQVDGLKDAWKVIRDHEEMAEFHVTLVSAIYYPGKRDLLAERRAFLRSKKAR